MQIKQAFCSHWGNWDKRLQKRHPIFQSLHAALFWLVCPSLSAHQKVFISIPHLCVVYLFWVEHRKECWKYSGHHIQSISLKLTGGSRLIFPPAPEFLFEAVHRQSLTSHSCCVKHFSTLLTPTGLGDSSLPISAPPSAGTVNVLERQGDFPIRSHGSIQVHKSGRLVLQ